MAGTIAITGISELATPMGNGPVCGSAMEHLARIRDAAIVVDRGIITWCGPARDGAFLDAVNSAGIRPEEILDAKGMACVPGFIDSHTHFLFAGFRSDEFFWRLEGMPYMEIHRRGGGIRRSMEATRKASENELFDIGMKRLDAMLSMGITTVEGKSGYGLDLDTEMKQLRVMRALSESQPVRIVSTYMGAHAVPPEFPEGSSSYIDFLIREALPRVAASGLAVFADIFCERGVFGLEDSRRYLEAACGAGLGIRIHADEIERIGGAGLAAELGASSADHLLKASRGDLLKMKEKGVVATCLPLTAFSLREPFADARGMIDLGLAVALASDLNPGSSYSQSIPMLFALAVVQMGLGIGETLTALTLNAAASLGLAQDRGSLEAGKRGDLLLLDAPSADHLAYHVGMNIVKKVIAGGNIVR